ncbi:MAG: tyrosine-protein phosphatase [Rhodobacteraceae bacterium]|nr:tyrosine-protein phosphatase [Paracoccaceae bacterium]
MTQQILTAPVPGTLNFRPVDSYAAGEGRIRPGALWRSGAFDGIGREGLETLQTLRVTTVFDLRSDTEKTRRPSPLLTVDGFTVAALPHDMRSGDLAAVLRAPDATPEDCAATMVAIYRRLPRLFAGVYARWLRTVITCETPVALHCTAGKDRTGVGMALLLELMGTARDDIFDDYLRSNAARGQLRAHFSHPGHGPEAAGIPPEKIEPVIAADPRYLAAMFTVLDEEFGPVARYAQSTLGLTPDEIATLRVRLLG